jgi:hypothetical protein
MFRYYNGEAENPFSWEDQNAAHNFWEYERIFEETFHQGNFAPDLWLIPYSCDVKEWEAVLSQKPVDKEELFKLWLFRLLFDHLPDKYQSEQDHFNRLYFDTEAEPIEVLEYA